MIKTFLEIQATSKHIYTWQTTTVAQFLLLTIYTKENNLWHSSTITKFLA